MQSRYKMYKYYGHLGSNHKCPDYQGTIWDHSQLRNCVDWAGVLFKCPAYFKFEWCHSITTVMVESYGLTSVCSRNVVWITWAVIQTRDITDLLSRLLICVGFNFNLETQEMSNDHFSQLLPISMDGLKITFHYIIKLIWLLHITFRKLDIIQVQLYHTSLLVLFCSARSLRTASILASFLYSLIFQWEFLVWNTVPLLNIILQFYGTGRAALLLHQGLHFWVLLS